MCVPFLTVYLYLVVYIKFTYIILGYLLFLEDLQKCKCLRQFKTTLKTIKILFKTWTKGSGLWKQQKAKSISIILNLIIPYDHNILLRNIFIWKIIYSRLHLGFPSSSMVKNLPAGDVSLIPGSGRCPREGNSNLLQDSCLENPVDRGDWQATVHGFMIESDMTKRLNTHTDGTSIQFSRSVTLCDPMDCSMPGFPDHHQLPEFTQTHVRRLSDGIQSSHLLSSPLLPPSIFPSIRVFSNESVLIRWPKY